MKSVIDRMKEENTEYKIATFRVKQQYPYDMKIEHAERRAKEFREECWARNLDCHVSLGGLDSITLYLFLKSIGIDVPAVSVSGLEDKSIRRVHEQLGVIPLKSALKEDGRKRWTKREVLQTFGFPVLSKETASKIELLQNPTPDNATVRHAIITGETGEYGGNRTGTRMKLAQKWLNLFAGGENEREGVCYQCAPFKVSAKCCYYLKEKPCDDYGREHNSVPYLGLMASEGGRRQKSLMIHGCNYFGKTTIRSAPFAIFNRQDILQLALDLRAPVPEIYGAIERADDGTLFTTRAQRTGCSMCGFGIQLEKRPHRFDRLYEDNPLEWEFWMMKCCVNEYGQPFGWGTVLDYIGVGWMPDTLERDMAKQRRSAR